MDLDFTKLLRLLFYNICLGTIFGEARRIFYYCDESKGDILVDYEKSLDVVAPVPV